MSDNLFDDETINFLLLSNDERQYSMWPAMLAIPAGWRCEQGPWSHQQCVDWLQLHWTDLRPHSLQLLTKAAQS